MSTVSAFNKGQEKGVPQSDQLTPTGSEQNKKQSIKWASKYYIFFWKIILKSMPLTYSLNQTSLSPQNESNCSKVERLSKGSPPCTGTEPGLASLTEQGVSLSLRKEQSKRMQSRTETTSQYSLHGEGSHFIGQEEHGEREKPVPPLHFLFVLWSHLAYQPSCGQSGVWQIHAGGQGQFLKAALPFPSP